MASSTTVKGPTHLNKPPYAGSMNSQQLPLAMHSKKERYMYEDICLTSEKNPPSIGKGVDFDQNMGGGGGGLELAFWDLYL